MDISIMHDSPVGKIAVSAENNKLCTLKIGGKGCRNEMHSSELLKQLDIELTAYFTEAEFSFTVPYTLRGTDFQQRVWQALTNIPVGSTLSYGQLALQLGSSPRAIGNACRANPLPIIVPCHRVVGKKGMGGYDGQVAGKRLDIKRWLLKHEGVRIN